MQNPNALGGTAAKVTTTTVLDQGQLQLQIPLTQNAPIIGNGFFTTGQTFYYAVTAVTSYGQTPASNVQSITTTANGESLFLSWTSVPGALGYNVYRSTTNVFGPNSLLLNPNTGVSPTVGPNATTFTDSGSFATTTGTPTFLDVANENLILSGSGVNGTGALVNLVGSNVWGGPTSTVTLTSAPGYSPPPPRPPRSPSAWRRMATTSR